MTWHLKDRELEKSLIEIDTEFLSKLNTVCEILDTNKDGDIYKYQACVVKLNHYGKTIGELFLTGADIEYKTTYNPHAWNNYPEVTPPEGVWMRLEICQGSEDSGRMGAKYVNGKWLLDDGAIANFGNYPARFRPWED